MKKHDDQQTNQEMDIDDQVVDPAIAKLQQESEEWKNKYLRALADYQNLEKRSFQEKNDIRTFASETTLRKMIPAIDTLERAVKHIKDDGLTLSLKEFQAALSSCGVQKIETVGKSFDPFTMECLEVGEGKDGIVLEEILPGYTLFDKTLRVAQVKVGKK